MRFIIEKRGQNFLVVNDTTSYVRGVHKTEGEAKLHAKQLQTTHDEAVQSASASVGERQPAAD